MKLNTRTNIEQNRKILLFEQSSLALVWIIEISNNLNDQYFLNLLYIDFTLHSNSSSSWRLRSSSEEETSNPTWQQEFNMASAGPKIQSVTRDTPFSRSPITLAVSKFFSISDQEFSMSNWKIQTLFISLWKYIFVLFFFSFYFSFHRCFENDTFFSSMESISSWILFVLSNVSFEDSLAIEPTKFLPKIIICMILIPYLEKFLRLI